MDAEDSSLIEGIGDEVVILLGTVLAAFVAIAAWLSTRPPPPREPPRFVVRRPHRHVLEFYAPVSPETRTPPVYPSGQAVTEAITADSAAAPSSTTTSSSEAVAVCSGEVTAVCSSEASAVSNMEEEEEEEEIIEEVKEDNCEEQQQNIVDEMEVEEDSGTADTIRLKFVDDTIRCIATCCETTTVGSLKERLFAVELSAGRVIRLIFAGQLLRDDSQTLQSYGVADGSVIHCHVGQQRQQQQQQQTSTPQSGSTSAAQQPRLVHEREMDELQLGVNLSSHSLLIFGFVFGLIWFCALRYPEFFDFTALFTLSISSVIYCAFTYGVLRQRRNTVRRNT